MECERGRVTGERCGMKCHAEARRGLAAQDDSDARHTRGDDVLKWSATVATDTVRSAKQSTGLTTSFRRSITPKPC